MTPGWPPPGLYVARATCGTVVIIKRTETTAKTSRPCVAPFLSWLAIEMEE